MDSSSSGQHNKTTYIKNNSQITNNHHNQNSKISSSSSSSSVSTHPQNHQHNNNNNINQKLNNHHITSTSSHFHPQPNSPLKNQSPDFYIIRVTYETDNVELDGIVLYKSIMLGNNERTPQVIKNAMLKLGLEGDPDAYTLAQVLPEKELILPHNANVYYAANTDYNLNFILRRKTKDAS